MVIRLGAHARASSAIDLKLNPIMPTADLVTALEVAEKIVRTFCGVVPGNVL